MSEEYSLEGARDSLGQSIDGYRSANFRAQDTGVDATIWITTKNVGDHTPVARVEQPRHQFIAITLEPEPRVIGDLPIYIRGQARRWVRQNLNVLLSYWNEELNTSDALDQLTAIGQ